KFRFAGDVFVDDKTSAVAEWRAAHPKGAAIRWSTPHNARDQWDGVHGRSWVFVAECARAIADGRCGGVFVDDARGLDAELRAGFRRWVR
ncbi:MAG TPA: hypothetical protein VHV78_02700, partial [Gemmatimonadaceae bacterium]|nr:hypothetical protein [Gemmatimonadaceae bacterium]